MNLYIVFILTLFGSIDCQFIPRNVNTDYRIVGGVLTTSHKIPYQVSIQKYYRHMCGGMLVSVRHVLTAAHCVHDCNSPNCYILPPHSLRVMAGHELLYTTSPYTQYREVIFISAHSSYNPKGPSQDNDIAIIKVAPSFELSLTVQLATLRRTRSTDGELCIVSGWGTTSFGDRQIPNQLMQVEVPLYNYKACNMAYGYSLSGNMICAGYSKGGKDACQGDSGGPLTCSGQLTGIVSFGYGCARPNYPGVYTEVYRYQRWISKQAAGNDIKNSVTLLFVSLIVSFYFRNQ